MHENVTITETNPVATDFAQSDQPATPQPPAGPILHEDALHGPAGRFVRALAPHTEAHPAALLLQLLAAFGNLIGRGPHCKVESTRHALNLFVILVGDSSKARKGTSWNHIAALFHQVDPHWLSTRVNTARLTASGVVKALRDQQPPTDRRMLALSEEFAAVLSSLKAGSNHLSPLLRCAWDSGNLPTPDLQQPQRASDTHISLIAHITQSELSRSFAHHQAHNGFANRCLWTWVERSNCHPAETHPDPQELAAVAASLRCAAAWATARPEILFTRDQQAASLWAQCYDELSYRDPGLRGAATSRGEAQVLRLSALYAALDCSELIGVDHLSAALAVWSYCYGAATLLFGMSTGDAVADRIRQAVRASATGLTKTEIMRLFSGHLNRDRIDSALEQLTALDAVASYTTPTRGRAVTRWATVEAS